MLDRLRAGFGHATLAPVVVIWGFGYLLVDILAFLLGRSPLGLQLLVAAPPMFTLGVGQTLALDWLRRQMQPRGPSLRWPLLLGALILAAGVQSYFDLYWLRWLALTFLPEWQEWALNLGVSRVGPVYILYLWTFCLALTLLWAARLGATAEATAARAASAEAAAARAEAAVLRLQLNPHFMFNTLNSISSLVLTDRKQEADAMIDRLCEFLRGSLYSDPTADVPLAQEIDSIDAYLGIEAARFGEDLTIEIDTAPGVEEAQVPNFILQPLVENAIKHGVSLVRGPATVAVRAVREGETLVLAVCNSVPDAGHEAPARQGTGIGLANIRQRLANRYGKSARLETGPSPEGFRAVIRLPFVDGPHQERAGLPPQ